MYMAELRGKLSRNVEEKEDILTSNVFSFFKYADRRLFLKRFLGELVGIRVSDKDVDNADFLFWTTYPDYTEPDLVIIVGTYYILIESKYLSDFGGNEEKDTSQIIREMRGGEAEARNLRKEFLILAVTADYTYKPEKFEYVKGDLESVDFKWISWQQICDLLLETLDDDGFQPTTRLFCEDLCALLDRKKLRSFRDFVSVLGNWQEFDVYSQVFFESESAVFRGGFIGFLTVLEDFDDFTELPAREIFWESKPIFETLPSNTIPEYHGKVIFFG